jgi:predicted nucleic-acid-binding Zn-ribbon protein
MSEYFSVDTSFEFGTKRVHVKPSVYESESSKWTTTKLASFDIATGIEISRIEINPGSDLVKIIASPDQKYIAVICESQWYEDFYIYEVSTLRQVASFEGIHGIDGSSECIFF